MLFQILAASLIPFLIFKNRIGKRKRAAKNTLKKAIEKDDRST